MVTLAKYTFDLLLFVVWPGHFILTEFLYSKPRKNRRNLKLLVRQLKHRQRWDRDILEPNRAKKLAVMTEEAEQLLANPDTTNDACETYLAKTIQELQKERMNRFSATVHEWLELLIVVFGVIMGIRSLFLQPFKIPTGSMQPTLHGINFYWTDDEDVGPFRRVVDYVNESKRYANVVAKNDGYIMDYRESNPLIFFPKTTLITENERYKFPGAMTNVWGPPQIPRGYVPQYHWAHYQDWSLGEVRAGQVLARGYLELGDHLFVDRLRFNFMDPQRGDITVFITDGIRGQNGGPLRGRFFIKRLVGLPGETLKIKDRRLYVKTEGASDFRLVDGNDHPAFDRIYSFKGNYRGYSHSPKAQYLRNENEHFTLGEDEYFMLGDNSENSADSRFWGVVPRKNIVGRACFVYWPFTRRWGPVDRSPPLNFDSPPTEKKSTPDSD